MTQRMWTTMILVALATTAGLGCNRSDGEASDGGDDDGEGQTSSESSEPQLTVSDADEKKAKELADKVERGRLPRDAETRENAAAIAYLAATASDPTVQAAAFMALNSVYTTFDADESKAPVDDTFRAALLAGLRSEDGRVLSAALSTTHKELAGKSAHPAVIGQLAKLTTSHPTDAGRIAALAAIGHYSKRGDDPVSRSALLDAMSSKEPAVLATALKSAPRQASDIDPFWEKATSALKHADPGVRGRAAEAVAWLTRADSSKRERLDELVVPMLEDDHAFVRSMAARALGDAGYLAAVKAIIPLLDDRAGNTYDLRGFTTMDGKKKGRMHFDGSAWSQVRDAALSAIRTSSRKTSERFDYEVSPKTKDADLSRAATEAKAWYGRVKGQLAD